MASKAVMEKYAKLAVVSGVNVCLLYTSDAADDPRTV